MGFTMETEGFGHFGVGADLSIFGDMTFEEIGKKALTEVMPDMESSTKAALRLSVKHSGESELVNSVKCYEPTMTKDNEGLRLVCQPTGKSTSGNRYHTTSRGKPVTKAVTNNDKAFWLEYGVAGRQAAHPWKDRALADAEAKVMPKIERAIEKELGAE